MDLSRMPAVKAVHYVDNNLGDLVFSYLKRKRRGVYTFFQEGFMEYVCSNSKSLQDKQSLDARNCTKIPF